MDTWYVIGCLVGNNILPPPKAVDVDGQSVHLKFRHRSHVDQWAQHLHLGVPTVFGGEHRYGVVHFAPKGGWCGHSTIYIYCTEEVG
jgi:hypothetical protein